LCFVFLFGFFASLLKKKKKLSRQRSKLARDFDLSGKLKRVGLEVICCV